MYLFAKQRGLLRSGSEMQISPTARTKKTISIGRFEKQPTIENFACKLKESMSKLSEREFIDRFLNNIQQQCYVFEFKFNQ